MEVENYPEWILVYTIGLETKTFCTGVEKEVDNLIENLKRVDLFVQCAKYKQVEMCRKGKKL